MSTTVAQRILERLAAQTPDATESLIFAGARQRDRALLRRCAIPHQFTADLLPVLDPELPESEAAGTLKRLALLHSVIRSPDGYALHDRARGILFAAWLEPANREELRSISERLVVHYEAMLCRRLETDYDKIRRRWLFHLFAVDEDRACSELEKRFEKQRRQLRFTSAGELLSLAREYESVLDPARLALIGYLEGKLAADRGECDKAKLTFRLTIRNPHAPRVLVGRAWNRLGLVLDDAQQLSDAASAFAEALKILRAEGANGEVARVLHNLGYVHRDTGNLVRAEQLLIESATLAAELGEGEVVAAARNALGTVHQRSGELTRAREELESALTQLDHLPFDRARVLNNLGIVCLELGDLGTSERYFHESYTIKRGGDDKLGEAYTLMNLSRLYRVQGRHDQAVDAVSEAARLFELGLDWLGAGEAHMNLARLHATSNDISATYAAGAKAIAAFQKSNSGSAVRDAEIELALLRQRPSKFGPWFWISLAAAVVVASFLALAFFLIMLIISAAGR